MAVRRTLEELGARFLLNRASGSNARSHCGDDGVSVSVHAIRQKDRQAFAGFFFGSRGAITYKALIWIIVLSAIVYGAYKLAPPYVSYYMLKTEVEQEARLAHMYTDEKLRERIVKKAQAWSVPISWEDVEIKRGLTNISINIKYAKTVTFPGNYNIKLEHSIMVTEPLREKSGILH